MNKRGKIISFWGAHYSIFDGAVSGWCELSFFSLFYFGRRESCLGRAPSYSSRGREAARETRERRGELLFLSGIVILILGSDFVPILGGLIIFPISLSPLLFSSPPLPTQPQEDQLCCGGNPCLGLVACSCSAPHERSTTRSQVIFPPIFLLPLPYCTIGSFSLPLQQQRIGPCMLV